LSDKALKMLCGRLQAVNRIAFIARNSIARLYIEDKRPLLQRHHRGFPRKPARVDAFCSPANQPSLSHRHDDGQLSMVFLTAEVKTPLLPVAEAAEACASGYYVNSAIRMMIGIGTPRKSSSNERMVFLLN
jgi:hypothetical protein